jgi:ATP-dependent exoDNAse (exonuclease V) beta subunit
MIADAQERNRAIDPSFSCIVQAPAGSGKTELLIQRLLALLAEVEQPQQILAITFTNKAAAEMRERLLVALQLAAVAPQPTEDHAARTWDLARAALHRHGAELLLNPGQLAIQTIDSFNASLVRRMPWISRLGGMPEISEDADDLYRAAVARLLERLESAASTLPELTLLLRHLDNNVNHLQQLLIDMLSRRDQWLRHLPVAMDSECARHELEQAVEALCCRRLARLKALFPRELVSELNACLLYAADHSPTLELSPGQSPNKLPGSSFSDLPAWVAIADLLLTATGQLRRRVTVQQGFPAGKEHRAAKQRMLDLLEKLAAHPELVEQLAAVRTLPPDGYSRDQWQLLDGLIALLPRLTAELWLVFRERGQVDFGEIAMKALQALGSAADPSELLMQIDCRLRHILVDEFQDTSRLQYDLLSRLLAGWTAEDGRTLFLVGDPMQSIYRFREAEVGLYLASFSGSFGRQQWPLQPLQLQSNFRSQQGLVDWVNRVFAGIFPGVIDLSSGAVPFAAATAIKGTLAGEACSVHPLFERDDPAEAELVVKLVQQAQAQDPEQTVAILVRGRTHLYEILPRLRRAGLKYQARDIDLLGERSTALDIRHLTRALLHRADRLSWIAVLRAPWCGLTLNDLHVLLTDQPEHTVPSLLARKDVIKRLSLDGQARLARVWPVFERALARRGRLSLRRLVEGCWLALGGAAACDDDGRQDAQKVFELLELLDQGGDLLSFERFDRGLERLFAATGQGADGKLQIMTIHKAKGLEFGTVIVPGLGKAVGRPETPLLRWLEDAQHGLLMAPLPERGSQGKDPLYQLLGGLEAEKDRLERVRLLYVAVTRAVNRLHLIGHVQEDSQGNWQPVTGSFLELLWPRLRESFSRPGERQEQGDEACSAPPLTRLPQSWRLPEPAAVSLPSSNRRQVTASGVDEEAEERLFSGWENPRQRVIGTLIHEQLELIGRRGEDAWLAQDSLLRKQNLGSSLQASGFRKAELETAVATVCSAIDSTLASERGGWILRSHRNQACELALSGLVEGTLTHASIDRTFVADGARWIIDYKSSSPAAEESRVDFIHREAERYRRQMWTYTQLMAGYDPAYPVRTALYFPLIDGWYVYPEE